MPVVIDADCDCNVPLAGQVDPISGIMAVIRQLLGRDVDWASGPRPELICFRVRLRAERRLERDRRFNHWRLFR